MFTPIYPSCVVSLSDVILILGRKQFYFKYKPRLDSQSQIFPICSCKQCDHRVCMICGSNYMDSISQITGTGTFYSQQLPTFMS